MKVIKSILLFTVSIVLISSCFDPPEYPNTPQISFDHIEFFDNGRLDSLVVIITFKDGDGDLGLTTDEIDSPYHEKDFFLDSNNKIATVRSASLPNNKSLPPFIDPHNCLSYDYDTLYVPEAQKNLFDETYQIIDTIPSGGTRYYALLDTFYVERNPNYYNIDVRFFYKNNSQDEYTEFVWETLYPFPTCGDTFNGRFPATPERNRKNSLEGTLKYAMKSNGFVPILGANVCCPTRTWKIEVQIKDRALNKSNVVSSGDFTLTTIRSGG